MTDIQIYGYNSKVSERNIGFNVVAIHNNGYYNKKDPIDFPGYTYIITEYGYIYKNKRMENTWEPIPGLAVDIAADFANEIVYAISKSNTS